MNSRTAGTPVISRVYEDGTLVELVYDRSAQSTALVVSVPGHPPRLAEQYVDPAGTLLVPYSAQNNLLATDCVLFPSDIGEVRDIRDVVADVSAFLHRYVDLTPDFEELAAYYILLTWVYDAFNEVPYLRFRGDFGTGKTRALLTVGSLCYKPFFASGASTTSPIFHILDAVGGTLVLDEADLRFSDATAELTKILNNGNVRGLPVLRTLTNRHRELNPTAFRVFGPKLIGMRERFTDDALESRFLTEETGGRPVRAEVPIHTPAALSEEATALRNQLLAWRFHARANVGPKPERLLPGVSGRTNQIALPLLSLIDDEGARERVVRRIRGEEERQREERADTLEAAIVEDIVALLSTDATAPVGAIARRISAARKRKVSAKRVGWIVRNRLRLKTAKSNGVYGIGQDELPRVRALAHRYGIANDAGS